MRKERNRRIMIALVMVLLMGAFILMCIVAESVNAYRNANDRAQHYFDSVSEIVKMRSEISEKLVKQQDIMLYQLAHSLSVYYDESLFRNAQENPDVEASALRAVCDSYGAEMMMVTDAQGKVIFGSQEALNGQNITECGLFTPEQYARLMEIGNKPGYVEIDSDLWILTEARSVSQAEVPKNGEAAVVYAPYVASMRIDGKRYYAIVLVDYGKVYDDINALLPSDMAMDTGSDDEFLIEVIKGDSAENSYIFYGNYKGRNYSLSRFSELGFPEELLEEGYADIRRIDGEYYYCRTESIDHNGGNTLLIVLSSYEIIMDSTPIILPAAILLWICLYMFCFKGRGRQMARVGHSEKELRRYYVRSLSTIALAGSVLVFAAMFYMQSLSVISQQINYTRPSQRMLFTEIKNAYNLKDAVNKACEDSCVSQAKLSRIIVEMHPEYYFMDDDPDAYRTYAFTGANGRSLEIMDECGHPLRSVSGSAGLRALCEDYGFRRLTLYNADGYAIADSGDEWYARIERDSPETGKLFEVLDRKKDAGFRILNAANSIVQTAVPMNYYVRAENGETVFVTKYEYQKYRQEKTGARVSRRQGLLVCEQTVMELIPDTGGEVLDYAVSSREKVQGCKYIVTDTSETHRLLYGGENGNDENAADLGLSESVFSGEYIGFYKHYDQKYLLTSRQYSDDETEDMFVISLIPVSGLYGHRLGLSLMVFIGAAAVLGLMVLMLALSWRVHGGSVTMVEPEQEKSRQDITVARINLIVFMFAVIAFIYLNGKYVEDSMFRFILSGSWDRGVNLFSLSMCLFMAIGLLLLSRVLRVLESFFRLLSARGETMARLSVSAIKYGTGIFTVFYSLYLFGLDTASVLRSLGAFSLIVGLGAQSLIKDIIAGIFIVFEGSYHVGDIVQINGFRGKVTEIALRTTRLESLDGIVKIFSNSTITNIENLSISNSSVFCDLRLPLTTDPDEAKELILNELPEIAKRIPELRGDIEYNGIVATDVSSYVIRLIAACHEYDRGRLWRKMNREMIMLVRKLNPK